MMKRKRISNKRGKREQRQQQWPVRVTKQHQSLLLLLVLVAVRRSKKEFASLERAGPKASP